MGWTPPGGIECAKVAGVETLLLIVVEPALFIESGRDWLRAPESAVDSSS
jgi:hypothetical protein